MMENVQKIFDRIGQIKEMLGLNAQIKPVELKSDSVLSTGKNFEAELQKSMSNNFNSQMIKPVSGEDSDTEFNPLSSLAALNNVNRVEALAKTIPDTLQRINVNDSGNVSSGSYNALGGLVLNYYNQNKTGSGVETKTAVDEILKKAVDSYNSQKIDR